MLKTCLSYLQQLLVCFNFCVCFVSWIYVGITSSSVRINICTIIVGIKKYNSIIKKKKKTR